MSELSTHIAGCRACEKDLGELRDLIGRLRELKDCIRVKVQKIDGKFVVTNMELDA